MLLQFENPGAFFGLIGVSLLGMLMLMNRLRFPSAFRWRRFAFAMAAFSLCIAGLARPQLGHQVTHKRGLRGNLFVAVDISRSMLATDVVPSRLGLAVAFGNKLLKRLTGMKVALFPFALDGYMMIPLTADLDMASDMLATLSPAMTTNQGTDLSHALEQLFQQIQKMETAAKDRGEEWAPAQVLLFSDGESHVPLNASVLDYYRKSRIPVFTVTVGTAAGAVISIDSRYALGDMGDGLRNPAGKSITTKANPELMRRVSHLSGGDYFAAELKEAGRAATRIMQAMAMGKLTSSFKVDKELYPVLFLIAMLLFSVEFLFGRWEYAIRALLPFFLFVTPLAHAEGDNAAAPPPQDPAVRAVEAYNEGLKKLGAQDYPKASELFQESASLTKDKGLQKKSLYNLGNSLMRMRAAGEAVQAYQQARDAQSGSKKLDADANRRISENLLLAVREEQRQKQAAQQQQQQQQQQSGEGDNKNQQPNDPKGPKKDYLAQNFDEKQKQKMFDQMASEEQQIMQRLMQEKNRRGQTTPTDKPW